MRTAARLLGFDLEEYRDIVRGAVDLLQDVNGGDVNRARQDMVDRLTITIANTRAYQQGNPGPGAATFYGPDRLAFLPVEIYWYRGRK